MKTRPIGSMPSAFRYYKAGLTGRVGHALGSRMELWGGGGLCRCWDTADVGMACVLEPTL